MKSGQKRTPSDGLKKGLQLALAPARAGRMGRLDLGRDYMAGVRARARMLARATRFDGDVKPGGE